MDNNQNQQQAAPVPEIPTGELKMPAESVPAEAATIPAPKRHISPLLVILLVFSLVLLGAVIVWGDKIIETLIPMEQVPAMDAAMDTSTSTDSDGASTQTTEEELAEIEAEASTTEEELNEADAELDAIEAEIDAELE
ncbi:hypothetical protein A2837_02820 [Candidatus Kaiserbacteria bacterium RIFCSPHIGHO2_01_FULL_46_22]|uniref:Uncharacterized protein n=1 Tax=Candidatus Kaiserbacteria bacterium RIFCSPHIGHO2_01_FULL_46_22 TaxID=1798475 RepID=A0A1F6BWX5_9BACT|nr:MAG: hypothetical protein A2837_02820 [Candidatus Kaiserbacteria bacterium RIFCSPHIGHO2_01_FULL_46_22]